MNTGPEEQPGARCYRVSTYLVVGHDGRALARHLADILGQPPRPGIALECVEFRGDLLALSVETRSTDRDDWSDAGTAHELQLHGDAAATYWTHTAATLMTVACTVLEQLLLTVPLSRWSALGRAAVRITPLGDPIRSLRLDPRRGATESLTEVDLHGVAPVYGKRLAGLVRDNLDEERWGPARTALPTVRYDTNDRALRLRYHQLDGGGDTPTACGLIELAGALRHGARVVGRVGAVAAAAVEAATRDSSDRG